MCSIEDAWGTPTFYNKKVETQADDRISYMTTPDNLLFPGNNPGPLTKNLPNKNRFTRNIHSQLSRQQRVPNMTHQLRGGNGGNDNSIGQVNTNIDVSQIGSYKPYTPDYMNVYSGEPQPIATKTNNIQDMDASMCDPAYSNFDDAFMVSNTVDRFMNMGMDMSDDQSPVELVNNVNYNWEQGVKPKMVYGRGRESPTTRNNVNRVMNHNEEPMPTHMIKEQMENNEEVIKLLNNILSRLDKMENGLNAKKQLNVNDLIIYFTLGCVVILILLMIFNKLK